MHFELTTGNWIGEKLSHIAKIPRFDLICTHSGFFDAIFAFKKFAKHRQSTYNDASSRSSSSSSDTSTPDETDTNDRLDPDVLFGRSLSDVLSGLFLEFGARTAVDAAESSCCCAVVDPVQFAAESCRARRRRVLRPGAVAVAMEATRDDDEVTDANPDGCGDRSSSSVPSNPSKVSFHRLE